MSFRLVGCENPKPRRKDRQMTLSCLLTSVSCLFHTTEDLACSSLRTDLAPSAAVQTTVHFPDLLQLLPVGRTQCIRHVALPHGGARNRRALQCCESSDGSWVGTCGSTHSQLRLLQAHRLSQVPAFHTQSEISSCQVSFYECAHSSSVQQSGIPSIHLRANVKDVTCFHIKRTLA